MTIKQISLFLENKPAPEGHLPHIGGRQDQLSSRLLADTQQFGIVRLIVEGGSGAADLEQAYYIVNVRDVLPRQSATSRAAWRSCWTRSMRRA